MSLNFFPAWYLLPHCLVFFSFVQKLGAKKEAPPNLEPEYIEDAELLAMAGKLSFFF